MKLSNCCSAPAWLYDESERCSKCKENCGFWDDSEITEVIPAPVIIHIDYLQEYQARIWLMHNDSEHAKEWAKTPEGDLVRSVQDNLYQFGDDPQDGPIRVVTGNAKRYRKRN